MVDNNMLPILELSRMERVADSTFHAGVDIELASFMCTHRPKRATLQ